MLSNDIAIKIDRVGKCYHIYKKPHQRLLQSFLGSRKKLYKDFWALKDISFEIKKGETVGIIGLNGSGKSTLLQIICGTLAPTHGEVEVGGRLAALLELGAGFNPQFTGRENVYLNGALMGISQKEMDRKIEEIEAFAEIGEFIDQPVKMYSSGMFVRLAFASAINVDPDILVIDEALAVGDMVFQHRCMTKIRELKKTKNIIFVSHDISTIVSLCDKVIWLDAGAMKETGDPKSLSEHYQAYVYERSQRYINNSYAFNDSDQNFGRFGDNRAKIMEMKILNLEGKSVVELWPDNSIRLKIIAEGVEEISKPVIGFTVRDRLGNVVFSTTSLLEGLVMPELRASEKISVDFDFFWPPIMRGSYSFSAYIADGSPEENQICDWVYDALVLQASNGKAVTGLIGLKNVNASYVKF